MRETPKEIREKLVMDWYEKKLNRDELLRVLEGSKSLDEDVKKRIEKEILENFYENFDKAKEDERFQSADAEYREIKKNKNQLKEASKKLSQKKKDTKDDLEKIDESMFKISENVKKIDEKSLGKERKLKNITMQRDELKKQQKKIQREIIELAREREKLQKSLNERTQKYGTSVIVRDKSKKVAYNKGLAKQKDLIEKEILMRKEHTHTGYREKYFQLIEDKEEYFKNLISKIENVDLGIDKEKKKEVLQLIKSCIDEEIKAAKLGNSVIEEGNKRRKWLLENWKPTMEKLSKLRAEMTQKEAEIKEKQKEEAEAKEKGASIDELFKINETQYVLQTELTKLKEEYKPIASDIAGRLDEYNGKILDLSGAIVVETYEEREERMEREEEERKERERKEKERGERNALAYTYRLEFASIERKAEDFVRHQGGRNSALYSFHDKDRIVVGNRDRYHVGLVELFDCDWDADTTNSHSDPEYSTFVFVKVGNYVDCRKFVYRDAYDPHKDDPSKAYTKIIDAKIEGDTLRVRLGKNEGEKGTMYEFKIDETKNIFK